MSLSLQECVRKIQQEYPNEKPYAVTAWQHGYVFNLISPDVDPKRAHADFHYMNPNDGEITGSLHTIKMLGNQSFRAAWEKAQLVEDALKGDGGGEAEAAEHSAFPKRATGPGGMTAGYQVRRAGGTSSGFFNSAGSGEWTGYSDVLSHHGIKGQSWGVSNGPPYPLDQKTHNRVVKNAGKTKAAKAEAEKVAKANSKEGILDEVVAPLAVAAAQIGIVVGVRRLIVNAVANRMHNKRKQNSKDLSHDLIDDYSEDKDFSDANPPKMIQGTHTPEQDMAACNPKYFNHEIPGTSNNCVLCSFTYDLRRRGYDVTAKASAEGFDPDRMAKDIYENPRTDRISKGNFQDVYNEAARRYPEGSRGVIGCNGIFGGGHEMAWERQGGKLVVRCAQSQEVLTPQRLSELGFRSRDVEFIRTDHLKVKMSGIHNVCNEMKPDWKKTVKSIAQTRESTKVTKPKNAKTMTKAQKQKSLREQWKKQHPGVPLTAENEKVMDNWVKENMWSMQMRDEGIIMIHQSGRKQDMNNLTARIAAGYTVRRSTGSDGDELMHYGIKGQKWGVRRYQEENGTYTAAGRERYGKGDAGGDEKDKKKGPTNKDGEAVKTDSGSSKWKASEASQLSDEELNRRNSRLQREQQYVNATTPQWKKDAKQIATDALKKIFIGTAVGLAVAAVRNKYKDTVGPWLGKQAGTALNAIKNAGSGLLNKLNPKAPHQISMDEYMKNRG